MTKLKERRRVAAAAEDRQENSTFRRDEITRFRITNPAVAREVFACERGVWCVSFPLLSSTTIGSSRGVPPPTARPRFRLLARLFVSLLALRGREATRACEQRGPRRVSDRAPSSPDTHEQRCGTLAGSPPGAEPLHEGAIEGDASERTSTPRLGVATSNGG